MASGRANRLPFSVAFWYHVVVTLSEQFPDGPASMADPEGIEVIELDRAEYDAVVAAALKDVGMTYKQLARQARSGRFSSMRARKLWLAIGEPGSGC